MIICGRIALTIKRIGDALRKKLQKLLPVKKISLPLQPQFKKPKWRNW